MKRTTPMLAGALLALTGCTTPTSVEPPTVAVPEAWKETAVATASEVLPPDWWTIFEDPELDALEAAAVATNQDLRRAMARVAEARAVARLTDADRRPHLAENDAYTRGQSSGNHPGTPAGSDGTHHKYQLSWDLSYEIDIWGRAGHASAAVAADAEAVAADLRVVLLTLTADVARAYHEIRSLDEEIACIEATVALRQDAVGLQEARTRAGLINEVDLTRARSELASVEAGLHATRRQRARTEHALAVLCGRSPSTFSLAVADAPAAPPAVPAGLPSELLQRRPDVAAAEARVRAESSRIAVARADFFPRLSLTGSTGFVSGELDTLLDSDSRAWSIGPSLYLPILDGGANRASLAAATSRYDEAVAAYGGVVLGAFREVEDALSDLRSLALEAEAVGRAVAAARDTAALANERYDTGLSSYLDVVDAQRAALQAERQDARLRGEQATATVHLIKALGGGWSG